MGTFDEWTVKVNDMVNLDPRIIELGRATEQWSTGPSGKLSNRSSGRVVLLKTSTEPLRHLVVDEAEVCRGHDRLHLQKLKSVRQATRL